MLYQFIPQNNKNHQNHNHKIWNENLHCYLSIQVWNKSLKFILLTLNKCSFYAAYTVKQDPSVLSSPIFCPKRLRNIITLKKFQKSRTLNHIFHNVLVICTWSFPWKKTTSQCCCLLFPTETEQRSQVFPVYLHTGWDSRLCRPLLPPLQAETQLCRVQCKTFPFYSYHFFNEHRNRTQK